jgi:hypothetical protein
MRVTDVSLNFELKSFQKGSVGLICGTKYIEYHVRLWNIAGELAREESVAPIPYLGVEGYYVLGQQTYLGGRFAMSQYDYSGTHVEIANFYQIDAFIEYRARDSQQQSTGLTLRLGFHNIVIEFENHTPEDRFWTSQMIKGIYVSMYLSF